jgi:FG-GAP repeat/S-layer homology domain
VEATSLVIWQVRRPARSLPSVLLAAWLAISLVSIPVALIDASLGAPAAPAAAGEALSPADWTQLNDLLYTAQPIDGGAHFRNHASDLGGSLTAAGMGVSTDAGEVTIGLVGLGRGAALAPITSSATPVLAGTRATLAHHAAGVAVSEWWVNRPAGLEQGFTLNERPTGEGALRLGLRLGGSLSPALVAPDTVAFAGSGLTYAGLLAWDATGRQLATHFELAGSELAVVVDDAAALYPLTIDPTLSQQAYLKASNTGAADFFGWSVAVSGDTIVVGAWQEDSNAVGIDGDGANNLASGSGAAYVFTRSGGTWSQQAYLKASNTGAGDGFGGSVAVNGDTIVVGAGAEDGASNSASDSGAAYVFTRSGSTWSQQGYLKAFNLGTGDYFGHSVAVSGDTIVVGARLEDSNAIGIDGEGFNDSASDSGAAYVFTRSDFYGRWSQQAYLKASNTGADDYFGYSVAVSGDTIVVGAYTEDSNAIGIDGNGASNDSSDSGAAYVFTRSGSTWSQQAYLKAFNTGTGDGFGVSVAVSGDTIVVGAYGEDGASNDADSSGAAYVFARSAGTWSQQAYLKASNTGADDHFGHSVAVSGATIVVGAYNEDSNAIGVDGNGASNDASDSGAAYVFTRSGGTWSQQAYLKASNTGTQDSFGASVAVSGDTIAVGSYSEDSSETDIDGNGANNDAIDSGAAYAFHDADCLVPPFTDVPVDHPFCAEIKWMKVMGISTGFGDGTYRPSIAVTRQAMSAFMARLAKANPGPCPEPPFSDVPVDHPFCREIRWMKANNISAGFPDNTYRPSIAVSRQAMSAFMARLVGATLTTCTTPPFSDVPVDHPFCREIKWMKANNVSTGFPDDTYRPSLAVSRQAMSAFMQRVAPLLP